MTEHRNFVRGVFFMLLSAFGMSVVALLGKLAQSHVPTGQVLFLRFSMAAILCLTIFGSMGKLTKSLRRYPLKVNFLRAITVFGSQMCFYYCIKNSSLLIGVALLNTGPLFVPLLDSIWNKAKIAKTTWMALAIAFIGVLCILQPEVNGITKIELIGLMAGLFQASSQLILGRSAQNESVFLGLTPLFCFAALFASIGLWTGVTSTISLPWNFWAVIIGLGLASILNQMARALAYTCSSPSKLSLFFYFAVILAAMYDWMFYGIAPGAVASAGVFLVVLAGFLEIHLKRRASKKGTVIPPPV